MRPLLRLRMMAYSLLNEATIQWAYSGHQKVRSTSALPACERLDPLDFPNQTHSLHAISPYSAQYTSGDSRQSQRRDASRVVSKIELQGAVNQSAYHLETKNAYALEFFTTHLHMGWPAHDVTLGHAREQSRFAYAVLPHKPVPESSIRHPIFG